MIGRGTDPQDKLVSEAMRELADTSRLQGPLPDPSFIWWKAQLLRRMDAERAAAAPLDVGDHIHPAAAVLGAVALAAGMWEGVRSASSSPMGLFAVAVAALVLLSAVVFATVETVRDR
jgi:hypothetical protein